jgi:RecA-family ATPase
MPDGSQSDIIGPASVVMVSAEDGHGDTLRPRAEAANADLERLHLLTDVAGWDADGNVTIDPWTMPGDVDALRKIVLQENAKLVTIDPLNAVLHNSVNGYKDQEVRGALRPFTQMAEETGAAIVLVRHLTKAGGSNPLYRGGGVPVSAAYWAFRRERASLCPP